MKKLLAIVISTLLVLTLFASCKATKAENTLTPDPPTEAVSEQTTILSEEVSTTLPEKEEKQSTTKDNVTSEKTTDKQENPTKNPAPKPDNTTDVPPAITVTKEEAKAIALAHAGLSDTDIRHYRIELDRERKILVYEIEFDAGKFEYDYEVNAETGKIVKAEKEIND